MRPSHRQRGGRNIFILALLCITFISIFLVVVCMDYLQLWREKYVHSVFSAEELERKDRVCFNFFDRSGLLDKIFPSVGEQYSHVLFDNDDEVIDGFVHADRWVRALLFWEGRRFSRLEIKGFVLSRAYVGGALREWYERVSPEKRDAVLDSWNAYVRAPKKKRRVAGVSRGGFLKLGVLGGSDSKGYMRNMAVSFDGK